MSADPPSPGAGRIGRPHRGCAAGSPTVFPEANRALCGCRFDLRPGPDPGCSRNFYSKSGRADGRGATSGGFAGPGRRRNDQCPGHGRPRWTGPASRRVADSGSSARPRPDIHAAVHCGGHHGRTRARDREPRCPCLACAELAAGSPAAGPRPKATGRGGAPRHGATCRVEDRRLRGRTGLPNFMVGWPTWFGNRRTGLRDRWFERTTRGAFRGQPRLDG